MTISKISLACSCVELTEEQLFENAVEVIYVQIQSTEFLENIDPDNSSVKATYKIIEAFKTNEGSPSIAFEGMHNCAPAFMAGRNYILYLGIERHASICNGSQLLYEWTTRGKEKFKILRNLSAL